MPRRGARGSSKMSHSIKKILRRNNTPGIKGKKSKMKAPTHPGHRPPSKKSVRDKARDGEHLADAPSGAAVTGTEKRAAMRKEIGKKNRLAETARRRGIDISCGAAAQQLGEDTREMDHDDDVETSAAAAQAAKRALAFAPSSQRTFHKELATVLKSSDVLLEVLDARDPMGCRCIPLEDTILQRFQGKRVVLILNKVDLVPPQVCRPLSSSRAATTDACPPDARCIQLDEILHDCRTDALCEGDAAMAHLLEAVLPHATLQSIDSKAAGAGPRGTRALFVGLCTNELFRHCECLDE